MLAPSADNQSQEHIMVEVVPVDGAVTIRRQTLETPYVYKGFHYNLESLESVVALVKARGSKEHSVLFYDEKGVQVVVDDSVTHRPKDVAIFHFQRSQELKEWQEIVGTRLSQKGLIDFLKRRPPQEMEPGFLESLIASLQQFHYVQKIVGDFQYQDNNNIRVVFESKDGGGSVVLPQVFTVEIPLILNSEHKWLVEIELEVQRPTQDGERPVFYLTIPKFARYWREAVQAEVDSLKKALKGYIILAGNTASDM